MKPRGFSYERLLSKQSASGFQVDALDGLRGMAVLIVLLAHLSVAGIYVAPRVDFSGGGVAGVFLFFHLSFFLLTSILLKAGYPKLLTPAPWGPYFMRRFQRVYPLYLIMIILCYCFTRYTAIDWFTPIPSASKAIDHLVFRRGHEIFWTVAVEFRYYFVLPLLAIGFALLLKEDKKLPHVLVSIAAFSLVPVFVDLLDRYAPARKMAQYACVFISGAVVAFLYALYSRQKQAPRSVLPLVFEIAGWLALGGVVLTIPAVWSFVTGNAFDRDLFRDAYGLYAALWSVVLWGILCGSGLLRRIFEAKSLRVTGIISYSIYLWHMPVTKALSAASLPGPGKWFLVVGITFVISFLSYLGIEKPFMRPIQGFVPKGRRAGAGSTASEGLEPA